MSMVSIVDRPTRIVTLYRLQVPTPDHMHLSDLLDIPLLDDVTVVDFDLVDVGGAPGLWIEGIFETVRDNVAEWCEDAGRTLNRDIRLQDRRSAGLLLVIIAGSVYAVGYGQGHRLIPDDVKDHRFGISVAVRRLEARELNALMRRRPGARGRTDMTLVPAGLPIWGFGIEDHADVVGRASGRTQGMKLTYAGDDDRPIRIDGSAGLRLPLGVMPADLVSDIDEISRICRTEDPRPDLEFIERIQPVKSPQLLVTLNSQLDKLLGRPPEDAVDSLTPVVPSIRLDDYVNANSFVLHIGAPSGPLHNLELSDFLDRTNRYLPHKREAALRNGWVKMFSDQRGTAPLGGRTTARKWLEANISIGAQRFSLLDGDWYEIDRYYLERIQETVLEVLRRPQSMDLPPWDSLWSERRYNEHVQDVRRDYLCLDRKLIKDEFHKRNGVEMCDILAPDDTLVHVKKAHGSAPLSHLFTQALVAVQTLRNSPTARTNFADLVFQVGKGREIPESFEPKRVAFAILLKDGEELTPRTLFPFAQVALIQAVKTLQSQYDVEVEVFGISPTKEDGD